MGESVPVADTSFLYALFSSTDHFHARAIRAAESADVVLIPGEIYSETVSLILYRQGYAASRAAGDWLRSEPAIRIAASSRRLLDLAWAVFTEARGRLSYPDAIVVAWCRERKMGPLAFDEALLHRARASSRHHDRQRS